MKYFQLSGLVLLFILPVITFSYYIPEGCDHYITNLAEGSGGFSGHGCTLEVLIQKGSQSDLSLIERIDALKDAVIVLNDQIKQKKDALQPASCLVLSKDLHLGMTDMGEVRKLQCYLKTNGYFPDAECTGYYGEKTNAAVHKWQEEHSLASKETGIGALSRAALSSTCIK